MAYDYEQSAKPRRPPSTTPALVDGRAPRAVAFTVSATGGTTSARGEFTYDPTKRSLDYSVRVSGTSAASVYAITIDRDSAGKKGPIVRHLSGPGLLRASGRLTLGDVERRDLLAGRLALVVYTSEQPTGSVRKQLVVPSGSSNEHSSSSFHSRR
jgi:amidase